MLKKFFFGDAGKNQHIKAFFDKSLAAYGKFNYGCFIIDKRNTDNILIFSDLPEYFSDIYLKNKYQNIDPIIINSLNRVSPFAWDENIMINAQWKLTKIFESVKSHHNIISGHTFVLHCPDNAMALLSLYIDKFLMPDVNDNISRHKDEIQCILIHAFEMLSHLYGEKEENNAFINDLTVREKEILHWSSVGKTYHEISYILNITVSTVKFHMANVVKKLGVKNAKHAIRICIELNITP